MSLIGKNWAQEFENIDFGDGRLDDRFLGMVTAFGENFSYSLAQNCRNWGSQKAAYRFFSNDLVEEKEIIRCHRDSVLQRAKRHEWLIAVQDSTIFNFHKYHQIISGLGNIGRNSFQNKVYGLQAHATLLLSNKGECLGLLDWEMWAPGREIESEMAFDTSLSSANRWFKHLKSIAEAREELSKKIVLVADREADITGLYVSAKRSGVDVVLRSKSRRRISSPETGSLLYFLKRTSEKFRYEIKTEKRYEGWGERSPRAKRTVHQPRSLELKVHYEKVLLNPTGKKHGVDKAKDEDLECYAILVDEVNPSDKESSVQWLLYTTINVVNDDLAREVIEIYRQRWQIEEYFKTLKSGCDANNIRLESARKLSRYICMKSVIATEVYQLKEASRKRPEDSCNEILSEHQWKVLVLIIQQLDGKRLRIPKRPPTLHQAALWIGRLGGHLGRTRDGPPGVTTLWRGYQELIQKAEGFKLALEKF